MNALFIYFDFKNTFEFLPQWMKCVCDPRKSIPQSDLLVAGFLVKVHAFTTSKRQPVFSIKKYTEE